MKDKCDVKIVYFNPKFLNTPILVTALSGFITQATTIRLCNMLPPSGSATCYHHQAQQLSTTIRICNKLPPSGSATCYHHQALQHATTIRHRNILPPSGSAICHHQQTISY